MITNPPLLPCQRPQVPELRAAASTQPLASLPVPRNRASARPSVTDKLHQSTCCCSSPEQVSTADVKSQGTEIPHWLNSIPHTREQRQFFYREASEAVSRAVQAGEQRVQVQCTIPELNAQVDVFRIGTLLELARELAESLALDGKKVKISVQQPMGQGVFQGIPLSLSGVRKIMERMDWGEVEEFVSFGQVGADQIDESAYYLLICPQNIVGNTIMTHLQDMVDAAEAAGKAVIILNPSLIDVPSSGGMMGVRGRGERTAFAQSFHQVYHFRLLFWSSAQLFPIMGACRRSFPGPWEVYKRVSLGKKAETYRLVQTFDKQPTSKQMTPLFADD